MLDSTYSNFWTQIFRNEIQIDADVHTSTDGQEIQLTETLMYFGSDETQLSPSKPVRSHHQPRYCILHDWWFSLLVWKLQKLRHVTCFQKVFFLSLVDIQNCGLLQTSCVVLQKGFFPKNCSIDLTKICFVLCNLFLKSTVPVPAGIEERNRFLLSLKSRLSQSLSPYLTSWHPCPLILEIMVTR